jgi:hypothetical protein
VRPWLEHPLENTLLGRPGVLRNVLDAVFGHIEDVPSPVEGPVSSLAPPQEDRGGERQPAAWIPVFVLAGLATPGALLPRKWAERPRTLKT